MMSSIDVHRELLGPGVEIAESMRWGSTRSVFGPIGVQSTHGINGMGMSLPKYWEEVVDGPYNIPTSGDPGSLPRVDVVLTGRDEAAIPTYSSASSDLSTGFRLTDAGIIVVAEYGGEDVSPEMPQTLVPKIADCIGDLVAAQIVTNINDDRATQLERASLLFACASGLGIVSASLNFALMNIPSATVNIITSLVAGYTSDRFLQKSLETRTEPPSERADGLGHEVSRLLRVAYQRQGL